MALVLDVAAHPPADRAELVQEVIARSGARRRVALNAPAETADLRAESWQLGAGQVLRTVGTGLTLTRTGRDVRVDAPEMVAVALTGGCRYSACGVDQRLGPDSLVLVDFSTPYTFSHAGPTGRSFTTHVSYADLGVGVDTVRAAIPRLGSAAVLPLLRGHLGQLSSVMDEVTGNPAVATEVAAATTDLIRALVVSAAGSRQERDVLHETLRTRVITYIRAHLGEPDLTPARIAAVHHISVRTLYNVWGDRDGTLMDWVIGERLERVRRELALNGPGATTSAVARRWGFSNPGHFARRFRAAYGASPGEWLRQAHPAFSPPVPRPTRSPARTATAGE